MTEIFDMKNGKQHIFKCVPCNIFIITDDVLLTPQWPKDEHKYWQTVCPKCGRTLYGEYQN